MLRSWLVLLLLTHYLLVVGAGLVNRPEAPRYSAAHPYTHSADCQQQHYLRVDCFDTCNGDQQVVQKRTAAENTRHMLSVLKSIDVHCLTEAVEVRLYSYSIPQVVPVTAAEAMPAGFQTSFYPPPRRG
ncbi:hypothetical protein LGH70_01065 [Hymenobacter sp. BT635]|uniref:Uncharacterized protein n=1 Tax=Hymenobacter nitidus TaxID=2880929 RepID=A0ABS8A6Y9_9BACT|nr:hypothetical protein [Hymenobacter nitidus]MCB2376155.1 hypothetical protein [Hymenobacter nitidus]